MQTFDEIKRVCLDFNLILSTNLYYRTNSTTEKNAEDIREACRGMHVSQFRRKDWKKAVAEVEKNKLSIRVAAHMYNLGPSTISQYLKKESSETLNYGEQC